MKLDGGGWINGTDTGTFAGAWTANTTTLAVGNEVTLGSQWTGIVYKVRQLH